MRLGFEKVGLLWKKTEERLLNSVILDVEAIRLLIVGVGGDGRSGRKENAGSRRRLLVKGQGTQGTATKNEG